MAHYSGSQMQGPATKLCDYCHLQPAFPPYNYCSKTCGARAKASGRTTNGPPLCKQCGQRPVYKGHQFCGRNCANTWQAGAGHGHGHGNTQPQPHGHQQWNQMQNPSPFPSFNQGGGGGGGGGGNGVVKGLVSTIKGLVSQNQQPQPYQQLQPPQPPQQYPGAVNPPYLQQIPGHISPNPPLISPPITPMSSGMNSPMSSGMGGLMSPGMSTPSTSNQQYYDPPSPTSPDIQDPDVNDQTNGQHSPPHQLPGSYIPSQSSTSGQKSKTMNVAMKPPMNSTGGGNYDPNFDPHADPNHDPMVTSSQFSGPGQNTGGSLPIQAQAHAQLTVQVTSPPVSAGGHGNGYWDQNDPNNFLPQQSTLNSSNSSMTCRLNGCNKPVFVDPATHYQSEYCSQRHREEATIYGQANPCIMCLKMPRGPNDHFCSRACRDKALSP